MGPWTDAEAEVPLRPIKLKSPASDSVISLMNLPELATIVIVSVLVVVSAPFLGDAKSCGWNESVSAEAVGAPDTGAVSEMPRKVTVWPLLSP
jgi:hypothetical protein